MCTAARKAKDMPQSTHGQECSRALLTQGMRVYCSTQSEGYMPQSTHGQECSRAPLTPLRNAFAHFFALVFNKSLLKLRKDSHDSRLALPHRCHCACSCNVADALRHQSLLALLILRRPITAADHQSRPRHVCVLLQQQFVQKALAHRRDHHETSILCIGFRF